MNWRKYNALRKRIKSYPVRPHFGRDQIVSYIFFQVEHARKAEAKCYHTGYCKFFNKWIDISESWCTGYKRRDEEESFVLWTTESETMWIVWGHRLCKRSNKWYKVFCPNKNNVNVWRRVTCSCTPVTKGCECVRENYNINNPNCSI